MTGLSGSGLVLQLNGGDSLSFNGSGTFVFGTRLDNSAAYSVTVHDAAFQSRADLHGAQRFGRDRQNQHHATSSSPARKPGDLPTWRIGSRTRSPGLPSIRASGELVPLSGSPFASNGTTPTALTVDPNGQFLYVANSGSNSVSVYSIDATTGALTAVGFPIAAGTGPGAVTVDPTDHFLYVANLTSNDVSAFAISAGTLTPVVDSPFSVGAEPASLAIDPNGNFLYVTNFNGNTVSVFLIDPASGMLSDISGSPFAARRGTRIDRHRSHGHICVRRQQYGPERLLRTRSMRRPAR